MKINIEDIEREPNQRLNISFEEKVADLNDVIVKAELEVKSVDYAIEIKGRVDADIELECDRCLKKFNYHVCADIDETFLKGSFVNEDTKELELKNEAFCEELKGKKEIDITDLMYQSVILNIPNKKVCDINCIGSIELQKLQEDEKIDPRLQVFKDLSEKIKKEDNK